MSSSRPLARLHAVTNAAILAASDVFDRAAAIGCASSVALHVRAASLHGRGLAEAALGFRRVAPTAQLIVNDRVDVALAVAADGVHLPEAGLPVDATRRLAPGLLIGRSIHDPQAARLAAAAGADYVFLGPIFETASHPGATPLGLPAIRDAAPAKVVAIGGIGPDQVESCLDAGAYGVAAVSALWDAPDPGSVARRMLLLLGELAS